MYESLLDEAYNIGIEVVEIPLSNRNKGLYLDGIIAINSNIQSSTEKKCIMAEELGHHYTTVGNIINQSVTENRKQEEKARRWAVKKIASLNDFINAFEHGARTKEEFAEYMDITDEFLIWTADYYYKKYGLSKIVDEQYIIYFNPLGILKRFDSE